jgi:hypothetical protein
MSACRTDQLQKWMMRDSGQMPVGNRVYGSPPMGEGEQGYGCT